MSNIRSLPAAGHWNATFRLGQGRTIGLIAAIAMLASAGTPVQAQTPAAPPAAPSASTVTQIPGDCTQRTDPAKSVSACTDYLKAAGKTAAKDSDRLAVAHAARAAAYSAQGLHKSALTDVTRALYHAPKDAALWLQRGHVRQALGQNIRCAADFAIALRYDPKMTDALVGRGDCFRRLGALPKAIADADAALKLDPKSASAYAMRSYAQLRLGKTDQAVADAEEAIKIDPNSARAYLTRGLAQESKDKSKAEADVKKAVSLDPTIKAEKGLAETLKRFAL